MRTVEREPVTPEQVRDAMMAAGIERVESHTCSLCGYPRAYIREGDRLFYDPGCNCGSYPASLVPRQWLDAAMWINMQTEERWQVDLRERFGLLP